MLVSLWAMFSAVGILAGTYFYCPEARSLKEALTRLKPNTTFKLYHGALITWLILIILTPTLYIPATAILLAAVGIYPTRLFILAKRRASISRVREMLTVLAVSWGLFIITAPVLFALGTTPPVLGTTIPFAWETAFLSSSLFLFLMARAVLDPTGLTRAWTGMLVPETMVKIGRSYLIIHDSGTKAQSFLANSMKNLIAAGARIVVKASPHSLLLDNIIQNDQHFAKWIEEGKLQGYSPENGGAPGAREGISGKLLRPTATVYVTELGGLSPLGKNPVLEKRDSANTSELLLVENTRAPRSQVADFIRRNRDLELLDLSERVNPFSGLVKLDHSRLQGSSILLDYDSSSNYEDVVGKFLDEGTANAELPVLFTSKSSKLYRALKGRGRVKLVAASSLVSAPDELPDGEVQIPDKELGLVTSIASDFLENNRDMAVSFAFDSLTELVRGERWEQVYGGIKQIVELLSVPNATSLFLVDRDSFEARFLGALRALFSVQMSLNSEGLRVVKLGPS